MGRTLTYNELKQTVNKLDKDLLACLSANEVIFRAKEQLEGIFNAVPDQIAMLLSLFSARKTMLAGILTAVKEANL